MAVKLQRFIVYACVAFLSFNVTVIVVAFYYSPAITSHYSRRHIEEPDDPMVLNFDPKQQAQQQEPPEPPLPLPEVNAAGFADLPKRHNFRLPNRLITEYDKDVADRLAALVARQAPSRDPELISLVRDVIDPPPRNKLGYKMFKYDKTPQCAEVDSILDEKKGGFFVECGGLDGERLSNTAFLERDRAWQGLLIEMDPFFYTQLLGKNRKVWSLNACLSPYNYVTTLPYAGSTKGRGQLIVEGDERAKHVGRKLVVPCFPFETILLALNRTQVDYFSLDIEGFELPVLKSINWKRVSALVLSVEFNRGKEKSAYVEFMESHGYRKLKEVHQNSFYAHDFIFVIDKLFRTLQRRGFQADEEENDGPAPAKKKPKPPIRTKQRRPARQNLNLQ